MKFKQSREESPTIIDSPFCVCESRAKQRIVPRRHAAARARTSACFVRRKNVIELVNNEGQRGVNQDSDIDGMKVLAVGRSVKESGCIGVLARKRDTENRERKNSKEILFSHTMHGARY